MTQKICKCENPFLPVGGNGCEICGGTVPNEKLNAYEKELLHIPPTLGVAVSETIKIEDQVK